MVKFAKNASIVCQNGKTMYNGAASILHLKRFSMSFELFRFFIDGVMSLSWKEPVMYLIGAGLIWLAVKKDYEPMLLMPIGFGAILVNLPLQTVWEHAGKSGALKVLFDAGIATELFPLLIFVAIGAMIDFGPLFQRPWVVLFGAAAQFGIFATTMAAILVGSIFKKMGTDFNLGWLDPVFLNGFNLKEAAAIGIIGAADGPTTIFVANAFKLTKLIGPLSVAAYSYMSLVPVIQPPVIRALTSKHERMIHMESHDRDVPKAVKIIFPIVVTFISAMVAPISAPLIGSLMFGNLIRECGVVERLSQTAQNELANIVTLLLGITIGATMKADAFLSFGTILIMVMGLVAFVFDTAGGVLFAKFINLFLPKGKKINPMIGACGISAFPMSSRVIQKMALKDDPTNIILMHAVSSNVSGQLGSVIAGGIVLALVPILAPGLF
jgi:sodium ion-translocating decarboxylase beta subunit